MSGRLLTGVQSVHEPRIARVVALLAALAALSVSTVHRLSDDADVVGAAAGRDVPGPVAVAYPVPIDGRVRRDRRQRPLDRVRPRHRQGESPGPDRRGRGADGARLSVGNPVHDDHHRKPRVHVRSSRPEGVVAARARADLDVSERRAADDRRTRLSVDVVLRGRRRPGQRDRVRSGHERRAGRDLAEPAVMVGGRLSVGDRSASSPAPASRRRSTRRRRPGQRRSRSSRARTRSSISPVRRRRSARRSTTPVARSRSTRWRRRSRRPTESRSGAVRPTRSPVPRRRSARSSPRTARSSRSIRRRRRHRSRAPRSTRPGSAVGQVKPRG